VARARCTGAGVGGERCVKDVYAAQKASTGFSRQVSC
jgi:hypothetical protein